MRAENTNDVFYITASKWKIWGYAIFWWLIACIFLLPVVLVLSEVLSGDLDHVVLLVFCGPLFLLCVAIPFLFLRHLKTPFATITRNGFSGLKNFRKQSCKWTKNTVIYSGHRNLILANLDAKQSRASKLWLGPKATTVIHHFFVKESRQDILDAIERLSPYPVKETTIWKAAKFRSGKK